MVLVVKQLTRLRLDRASPVRVSTTERSARQDGGRVAGVGCRTRGTLPKSVSAGRADRLPFSIAIRREPKVPPVCHIPKLRWAATREGNIRLGANRPHPPKVPARRKMHGNTHILGNRWYTCFLQENKLHQAVTRSIGDIRPYVRSS